MDVKRSAVLILSSDPMAAALVGAAIEAAGAPAVFPRAEESPREALRRARPAVVAVDCEDGEGCSEAVLGPAVMMGAAVAVFGPAGRADEMTALARRLGVRAFCFPGDEPLLLDLVRRATAERHEP